MESERTDTLHTEVMLLRSQLQEATETLDAIRSGQIDALVVNNSRNGHQTFTLKTADHAYRMFIEQMIEGAVTLNMSGLIVYCNNRFAELVDRTLSNVLGTYFFEYISADFKAVFERLFHEGLKQPTKREMTLTAGNLEVPVLLSLNRLCIEEDAMSIIVTDLSAQKEHEKQLEQKNQQLLELNQALLDSNHDLQQFASVASHDLQEPLRKILVFSKFLKDRNANELSEQAMQYVDKIVSSSQRMKVLIIDILNYSRLSAEDRSIELIDFNELMHEIADDFDLKMEERNAQVIIKNLPSVEGNRGQIRQVFYNLISNALKFAHEDRPPRVEISAPAISADELGVSLTNEHEYCRISVLDNGIGFDEQFANSIFNLFEKLNPKSAFEGSGIGLAIAKKIIDKHHGLIIARSAGEGAEFNIILPLKYRKS